MKTYTVSPEVAAAIEECKKLYPEAVLLINGQPACIVGMVMPKEEKHFPKEYKIAEGSITLTPEEIGIAAELKPGEDLLSNYQRQIQGLLVEVERLKRERDEANSYSEKQAAMIRDHNGLITALRQEVKVARMQRDHADNALANVRARIEQGNTIMESLDKKMHAAWTATNPVNRPADVVR